MRIRRKVVKTEKETNLLCFKCANAAGGCSWSRSFDPVEGWTATPVNKTYRVDYSQHPTMRKQGWHITACPEFKEG